MSRRKEAYWRRRFAQEEKTKMLGSENVQMTPPSPGFVLVAKRKLTLGNMVYQRNAEVPLEQCRNFEALLRTGHVGWAPRSDNRPSGVELPAPVVVKRPAVIELVTSHDSALDNWIASKKLMTERCGGSVQMADDLLHSIPDGRSMYRDAVRIATAERARREGKPSVPAVRL
ncbi:MAG: hypothetical protein WCD69_30335 [Xanthobacteraceae bacterium]